MLQDNEHVLYMHRFTGTCIFHSLNGTLSTCLFHRIKLYLDYKQRNDSTDYLRFLGGNKLVGNELAQNGKISTSH